MSALMMDVVKSFSMELMLKNHIKCFHKDFTNKTVKLKFVCPVEGCVRVYSHKRDVDRHIRDMHPLSGHSKRDFVCTHEGCDKAYATENMMRVHVLRVHHGVKVKCDWPGCGYIGLKSTIKTHRLRHQKPTKPVVCDRDNCGQRFTCNDLLREHIHDSHNADKLLSCRHSDCTFQTYKSREMKRHYPKTQEVVVM